MEELREEFPFPVTGFDTGNGSEFINHVVRKHAFYWRYDTTEERELLNRLWRLVSLRMNFFTPTKKPIGYDQTAGGRRRRLRPAESPVAAREMLRHTGRHRERRKTNHRHQSRRPGPPEQRHPTTAHPPRSRQGTGTDPDPATGHGIIGEVDQTATAQQVTPSLTRSQLRETPRLAASR